MTRRRWLVVFLCLLISVAGCGGGKSGDEQDGKNKGPNTKGPNAQGPGANTPNTKGPSGQDGKKKTGSRMVTIEGLSPEVAIKALVARGLPKPVGKRLGPQFTRHTEIEKGETTIFFNVDGTEEDNVFSVGLVVQDKGQADVGALTKEYAQVFGELDIKGVDCAAMRDWIVSVVGDLNGTKEKTFGHVLVRCSNPIGPRFRSIFIKRKP